MKIFPAIDIIGGKVVRLSEGDYGKVTSYSVSPEEAAANFARSGASCVHIVDLDGAKSGRAENAALIGEVVRAHKLFAEVGGGIRSEKTIESYLSQGVGRCVLGTVAVKNFAFVEEMAKKYPSRIAVGVDAKRGKVAVSGWEEVTELDAVDFCKKVRDAGVSYVVCTDISKDGMLSGANLDLYAELSEIEGLNITASGGVTFLEEIAKLKAMGLYGAIVGKAMYEGKISLKEAVEAAR
ncbi:MAG: 1-(5-phosphoribosyl)-5-[(5-phosphoribosylamino)methylideneamino]imidazole-4-carboxamide isomerase [Bacillota bacterium]|nr:MAG: 1-(5-phosphoribosyl)-5-[(5-phosphoribosylamino)methylideneamino]imidazole-4-carboxamide isomerase [Bacillota bacterium]